GMGYGGPRQWGNRGLAYVGVEKQNGSAAPVANEAAGGSTTPSVPGDRDAQQPPNTPPQLGGEHQGTGDPSASEQQSDEQQLNGQKANAQTQAAEGTPQDEGEQASEDGSPARNTAPEIETKTAAKNSVRGSGKEKPMRQTGQRTAGLGAASSYGVEREVSDPSQHSILVSAPEPGSPAFMVNFPGEAVSASTWVAISAR